MTIHYQAPHTLKEVVEIVHQYPTEAIIIAGGQVSINQLRRGIVQPRILVDIGHIGELQIIEERDEYYLIGACITHSQLIAHDTLKANLPALTQAARAIGDLQVRNRATIGGTVSVSDPFADYWSVFFATQAIVHLVSVNGVRQVSLLHWFEERERARCMPQEIIKAIEIPKAPTSRYSKFITYNYHFLCSTYIEESCEAGILAVSGLVEYPQLLKLSGTKEDQMIMIDNWLEECEGSHMNRYYRHIAGHLSKQLLCNLNEL